MLLFFAKAAMYAANIYLSINIGRWSYKQAKKDIKWLRGKMKKHLPHVEIRKIPEITKAVANKIDKRFAHPKTRFVADRKGEVEERHTIPVTRGSSSLQAQGESIGAVVHA